MLQKLLHKCESELQWLDMAISTLRKVAVFALSGTVCNVLTCLSGVSLIWANEIRYLGIIIVKSRHYKCSLDSAKRSFYRAANEVFGKIGRVASEEVTLEIIKSKCLPVLLYGLEVYPLTVSDLRALDLVVNRLFMKLFSTNLMDTVKICQDYFNFDCHAALLKNGERSLQLVVITVAISYVN